MSIFQDGGRGIKAKQNISHMQKQQRKPTKLYYISQVYWIFSLMRLIRLFTTSWIIYYQSLHEKYRNVDRKKEKKTQEAIIVDSSEQKRQ